MKRWDRRSFIAGAAAVAGASACGFSVAFLAGRSEARGLLRPPGALAEKEFLASCIKCGQCIQVCPFHSLSLLDLRDGIDMGTPVVRPRDRGCYLCDLLPCVLCCPSGALDPEVREIGDVHMGMALVTEPQRCWAREGRVVDRGVLEELASHGNETELEREFNERLLAEEGRPCELCVRVCPVPEPQKAGAIIIENGRPVIGRSCAGCGACAEACPEGIIEIRARRSFDELYGGRSTER